jgi:hypothetical protein
MLTSFRAPHDDQLPGTSEVVLQHQMFREVDYYGFAASRYAGGRGTDSGVPMLRVLTPG